MPPPSRDATQQIILETLEGVQEWIAEFSATARALFLPTGLLDWPADTVDEPANPPPSRLRSYVIDRVLQVRDANGSQGAFGELISTDADGIRRVVPPGNPGAILVADPSNSLRVAWGNVLAVSEIEGQHQGGSVWDYGGITSSPAGEVQYTRIFLAKDTTLNTMRVFRALGGSGARFVNLGVYAQTDPGSLVGVPVNKLAETGATATTGVDSYMDLAIGPVVIPATGFYWLAFVTDTATPLTWATTDSVYPLDFLPVRREVGAGSTLPGVASGLTNPSSAVAFVAAVE